MGGVVYKIYKPYYKLYKLERMQKAIQRGAMRGE